MSWKSIIALLLAASAAACSRPSPADPFDTVYYAPVHARGFEIKGMKDSLSRVIRTKAPWQGADSTAMELFIARGGETPPEGFSGQVIYGEAHRIAAMSSSYVAMLDLLEETERIRAVSGIDFISNSYVSEHRDSIADVGNETGADFEKLAAARPDLVLLYGITASSPMEGRLRSLGIPYFYVGEYLENDPLGKCEWLAAFGEIVGDAEKGAEVFRRIAGEYNRLKSLVPENAEKPKIMLNVPYGDIWYMASCNSPIAAMIEDAGGEYLYKDNWTNKSVPIDMEKAFVLASEADFWLDTGQIASMGRLLSTYPEFAEVRSVCERKVFNNDRRRSAGGGNDFWESGQARPDLVLHDLINIFHPGVLENEELNYYRRLD